MTTVIILSSLASFALGVFAGLSAAKIKSWLAAEEARVAADAKGAALNVANAATSAVSRAAADAEKKL